MKCLSFFSAVFGLIMIIAIVIRCCRNCLALFTRICAYYAYAQVATICAGILPLYPFRLPAWRTTNTPTRLPSHVTATATASHATPRHATPTSPHPGPPNSFNQVGNALARALLSNEDNVASNATSGVACLVGFDFLLLPIMSCLIPCCLLLRLHLLLHRLRLHLSCLGGSCSC